MKKGDKVKRRFIRLISFLSWMLIIVGGLGTITFAIDYVPDNKSNLLLYATGMVLLLYATGMVVGIISITIDKIKYCIHFNRLSDSLKKPTSSR